MAVWIVEAALIHEAVVLGFVRLGATGGDCLGYQCVYLFAAVARQAQQYLAELSGIGHGLRRDSVEYLFRGKHHGNGIADHHACRGCITHGRIALVAQCFIKLPRSLRFFDGQTGEDSGGYGSEGEAMVDDTV